MSHGLTTSTSLTLQEETVILHALKESKNKNDCLSRRLQFAIKEKITRSEFSQKELQDIITALELALKKSQNIGAEYYGHLSLVELRGLLEKIKELSHIFD